MKILIIKPGGVGDTLLLLPALHELRRQLPGAWIDIAGNREALSVFLHAGVIDHCRSCEDHDISAILTGHADPGFVTGYERLYLFVSDDGTINKGLMAAGCRAMLLQSSVQSRTRLPQWQYLADCMGLECVISDIGINRGCFANANGYPHHRYITIHPGSGGNKKNWHFDNFVRIIDYLQSRTTFEIVILFGYADEELYQRWIQQCRNDVIIRNQSPLTDIAAILADSMLFIGNDSGIAHLAGICRTPSIVLFGPSDPAVWAPLGKPRIIQSASGLMDDISSAEVCAAGDAMLNLPYA